MRNSVQLPLIVLFIGLKNTTNFTYYLGEGILYNLGVISDCKLKFQDHIKPKINKAYSTLGILRRNFKEMDVHTTQLYFIA